MPEASQYILDTTLQEFKDLEQIYVKEQTARNEETARHWAYYDGHHKPHLAAQKDDHDDNIIINNIEIIAEKLAGFLIGDGVTFDAGGDDEPGEADEAIEELWEVNRGEILQNNLALAGCVEGHLAVLLTPQTDDNGNMVDGLPRLTRIKQKHFAAFWDPFDMRRVLWYRLQSGSLRRDYVRGLISEDDRTADHDNVPAWSVVEWRSKTDPVKVAFGRSGIDWKLQSVTPWMFPWPPLVDWQNLPNVNDYYGKSDLSSPIHLNDALNFVISNLNRIVKHYADPKTIGIGFKATDMVPTQVGGFYTVPNEKANIYNLEMKSDGALARWLAEIVSGALWQSGGVVDPQTMKDQIGALTNFGLKILFTDAIRKVDKKRLLFGEALEAINKYSLELAGVEVPDTVTTIWPDVLPEDEKEEAETLGMDLDRQAISLQTYRERRGYDNKTEEGRRAEEQTNNPNPLAGLLAGNGFQNRAFDGGR